MDPRPHTRVRSSAEALRLPAASLLLALGARASSGRPLQLIGEKGGFYLSTGGNSSTYCMLKNRVAANSIDPFSSHADNFAFMGARQQGLHWQLRLYIIERMPPYSCLCLAARVQTSVLQTQTVSVGIPNETAENARAQRLNQARNRLLRQNFVLVGPRTSNKMWVLVL